MMKSDFIPFALHDIGREEIKEVIDTLKSNWITTGPKTALFEKKFAEYIGGGYALAVNSATAGLHLAMECINLQPNDKVITTPYTFTATSEIIRYFKADPVFIDIKHEDYNIDPRGIEKFCSKDCIMKNKVLYHKRSWSPVKAIVPVHIGGSPCDMDKILQLAKRYNLKVIEDAAHALPCAYKGKRIGTLSDITVFSFYATKTITTAEGGMIVTSNPEYCKRIKLMRLHGIDRDIWNRYCGKRPEWQYEVIDAGYKYNMTDISASIGIRQLEKADYFYKKRKRIALIYNSELKYIPNIRLPLYKNGHSWHLYIIEIESPTILRDDFIKKMYKKGIGTSVHFMPLHLHPYYKKFYNFSPEDFPVSLKSFMKVVSLPIYPKMTDKHVYRVTQAVKGIML